MISKGLLVDTKNSAMILKSFQAQGPEYMRGGAALRSNPFSERDE
jgi:hypothetical protein